MVWQADIDKWWNNQQQFVIREVPGIGGTPGGMFVLRSNFGGFDVNICNSELDAREFAFQMIHGVLHAEDQTEAESDPSSFEVRQMLVRWEQELTIKLGQPDLNERAKQTLDCMFDMVNDALAKGFLAGEADDDTN